MKTSKAIKALSVIKGIPYSQLAKAMNIQEQSFNNKLSRGNYKVSDLVKICEQLGVELIIKDGENSYSIMDDK